MLFIVSGRDKPDGLAARVQYRADHRTYYAALGDDMLLAGPYLDTAGEPIGSMIIMRAESQVAAERYAHADPYWTNGVFASLSVSRWTWFINRPETLSDD